MAESDNNSNSNAAIDDNRTPIQQKQEAEILNDMKYPAAPKAEKPPFELGAGLLETLDEYAAKLLDQGLTGIEECCTGKGRANKMLSQQEKHHGHHHHASNQNAHNEHVSHDAGGPNSIPRKPGSSSRGLV